MSILFAELHGRNQHQCWAELPALIERHNKRTADSFSYGRKVQNGVRQTDYSLIIDLNNKHAYIAIGYCVGCNIIVANEGFVNLGLSKDTAEFAVNSILRWWQTLGANTYPNATKLYINCDGGGSNGSRVKLWKKQLQELANITGLQIHVSHFPQGTSKWSGLFMKQCLVGVKNSLVLGRQDYQWRHEPILYGWKSGAAHYFTPDRTQTTVIDDTHRENFNRMTKKELVNFITEYLDSLDKTPQTAVYHDKPSRSNLHPTMKPIGLVGRLIGNSSKCGWIVQDLFAGSGSTMVACERLERQSRLMEYDPKYADVIVKRYVALTGDMNCYCVAADGARVEYADMFGG